MNILSLFDGMSCGQLALERCGIVVDNYFASEIDKHAIKVTMHNFLNTKQIGNVTDIDGYKLPKIDLLIGGSPCQSFSFAGKRKGMSIKGEIEILTLHHYLQLKAENYEFEGQSYLFWEYMRLLNEVKPTYFLLENVEMGEKWERILSKAIGINGIHINSALVSAQNRKRIYWTNIGLKPGGLFGYLESIIEQPKDKKILIKDILEIEVADKYFLSEKMLNYLNTRKGNFNNGKINYKTGEDVASCINASSGSIDISDNIIIDTNRKSRCFTAGGNTNAVEIVAMIGRENAEILTPKRTEFSKAIRKEYEAGTIKMQRKNIQQLEPRNDGKTNCLTSVQKDNLVSKNKTIRRLTPLECERLQTVKDNYTESVSDSQRYKMLGNGWTIDVIAHIFSYLKI